MIIFPIVSIQALILNGCCLSLHSIIAVSAFSTTTTTTTSTFRHHHLPRLHPPNPVQSPLLSSSSPPLSSTSIGATTYNSPLPLSNTILQQLSEQDYVIVPNYLPPDLVTALREDVQSLRHSSRFNVAKIGQDSTNNLNTEIRVAETCFLGRNKLRDDPSNARECLYGAIEEMRVALSGNPVLDTELKGAPALDANLDELLYAYYPNGGYYRRHLDAVPQSASYLRSYSLLIYLNRDWVEDDGGMLRIHLDGAGVGDGADASEPNFVDVKPEGGTLVVFRSEAIPHEVLETTNERMAVVGWYNRVLTSGDAMGLATEEDRVRSLMLIAAVGLVTVGLVGLLM